MRRCKCGSRDVPRHLRRQGAKPRRNPLDPMAWHEETHKFDVWKRQPADLLVGVHFGPWPVALVYAVTKAGKEGPLPNGEHNCGIVFVIDVEGLELTWDVDALHLHNENFSLVRDIAMDINLNGAEPDDIIGMLEDWTMPESFERPDTWTEAYFTEMYGTDDPDFIVAQALLQMSESDPERFAAVIEEVAKTKKVPLDVCAEALHQWRTLQPVEADRILAIYAIKPVEMNLMPEDELEEFDEEHGGCPEAFPDTLEYSCEPKSVALWKREDVADLSDFRVKNTEGALCHGTDIKRARMAFPEFANVLVSPYPCSQYYSDWRANPLDPNSWKSELYRFDIPGEHADIRLGVHFGCWPNAIGYAVHKAGQEGPLRGGERGYEENCGIVFELDTLGIPRTWEADAVQLSEASWSLADEIREVAVKHGDDVDAISSDVAAICRDYAEDFDEPQSSGEASWLWHYWKAHGVRYSPQVVAQHLLDLYETDVVGFVDAISSIIDERKIPYDVCAAAICQWRTFETIGFDRLLAVYAVKPISDYVFDDPEEADAAQESVGDCPQVFTADEADAGLDPDTTLLWKRHDREKVVERLGDEAIMYHGTDVRRARLIFPEIEHFIRCPFRYSQGRMEP